MEKKYLSKWPIELVIENYTSERQAEFILSNAVDADDYQRARKIIYEMGLDPDMIIHYEYKNF